MHGLKIETNKVFREKRDLFGTMTSEDGEKIQKDLESQREKTNEMIDHFFYFRHYIAHNIKSFCEDTTTLLEKLISLYETCYGEKVRI